MHPRLLAFARRHTYAHISRFINGSLSTIRRPSASSSFRRIFFAGLPPAGGPVGRELRSLMQIRSQYMLQINFFARSDGAILRTWQGGQRGTGRQRPEIRSRVSLRGRQAASTGRGGGINAGAATGGCGLLLLLLLLLLGLKLL